MRRSRVPSQDCVHKVSAAQRLAAVLPLLLVFRGSLVLDHLRVEPLADLQVLSTLHARRGALLTPLGYRLDDGRMQIEGASPLRSLIISAPGSRLRPEG
eukprot:3774639-Prymnesium_polylepis.1